MIYLTRSFFGPNGIGHLLSLVLIVGFILFILIRGVNDAKRDK